jgi:DNA-binding Xre family transcriptional regulator
MTLKERIKEITHELRVQQKELASLLGIKEVRIKNMIAGRVKNLNKSEIDILSSSKYKFSREWLISGQGPIKNEKTTIHTTAPLDDDIDSLLDFMDGTSNNSPIRKDLISISKYDIGCNPEDFKYFLSKCNFLTDDLLRKFIERLEKIESISKEDI